MAPEDESTPEKPEISYPAEWSYRIVCSSEEEVRAHVLAILGDLEHELSVGRASSGGKYVTLNLKVVVADEEHRLKIYEHLASHDAVRMVL